MQDANEMALFRFSIIAPLFNGTCEEKSISEYVALASEKTYYLNGKPMVFSKETIKKWYYNYKNEGYDGLVRVQRSDYQKPRALSEDAKREIEEKLLQYPKITATKIYSNLIKEGVIESKDVSLKTVQRYVKLLKTAIPKSEIQRRRFQMPEANDMWQSDTSSGPYVLIEGQKYRSYLVMFIDDYSRLITGYGFYLHDNAINMQLTLKSAIKTYGIPKLLYMDNGGPYVNQQLKIICARLGIICKNTRAYDPESKGKIERCFRTIKMQWMNSVDWNKFKSLEDVNKSFGEYVRIYNNSIHSSTGKTPNNAFHEYESIRRIDSSKIDEMFWHEVKRTADLTSCISVEKRLYEVPTECIGKECAFTYDPENMDVLYYKGVKCKLLNPTANSKKKRKLNVSYVGMVNDESEVIDLNEKEKEKVNEIS
ncbi:MAG: DDE-type integrase/transposase/recombinase [Bacteroidales bacterium]|nr:DDE-type integrase/transposase/recombinase [Bacteroidales bacterium]